MKQSDTIRTIKSPERRAHFEDDLQVNDSVFCDSFRKQITKIEYFYGPYKLANEPSYEDCVRQQLNSQTIQTLLKTGPQILDDVTGRGSKKNRKGTKNLNLIFSKQQENNKTETFTDVFSRLQSRQEKRYINFTEKAKINAAAEQRDSSQSPWKPIADKITEQGGRQFYAAMSRVKDRELMKNFLDRFRSKSRAANQTNRESFQNVQERIKDENPIHNPITDLKIPNSQIQISNSTRRLPNSSASNPKRLYQVLLKRNYKASLSKPINQSLERQDQQIQKNDKKQKQKPVLNKDIVQQSNTINYDKFIKAKDTHKQIEELVNNERSSDEETIQYQSSSRNQTTTSSVKQRIISQTFFQQLKDSVAQISLKERCRNNIALQQSKSYESVDYAKSYKISIDNLENPSETKKRQPQATTTEFSLFDIQNVPTPLYLQNTISLQDLVSFQQQGCQDTKRSIKIDAIKAPQIDSFPSYRQQRYKYYRDQRKLTKSMNFV